MNILEMLHPSERSRLVATEQPSRVAPMLATLTHEPFSHAEWIFERKLDGERCLAFGQRNGVRLRSRNDKDLNGVYPEVVADLEAQTASSFIADGEIVAFEGDRTSFSKLQRRMQVRNPQEASETGVAVCYYLFDLLYVERFDVTQLPLRRRKTLLKALFSYSDPLRFTVHRNGDGEAYFDAACRNGWEGVIAKRADSAYENKRSRNWLKFKCVNQQEFVVGGFTDPKGSRVGFGALLIGYYEGDKLVYAGDVGTGFDTATLHYLGARLVSLETAAAPFAGDKVPRRGVHWVKPELVVECGFTEWTEDGKLRHPRFIGLRDDKSPREVVREVSAA